MGDFRSAFSFRCPWSAAWRLLTIRTAHPACGYVNGAVVATEDFDDDADMAIFAPRAECPAR